MKRIYLALLMALTACGTNDISCPPPTAGHLVYVTGQGWHAELGVPVKELSKDLRFLKKTFPGATTIMIGYGKKTFFTAPAHSVSEYILGPVPGPAVIHAVGLNVTPVEAYPPGSTVVLSLTPDGSKALSKFIWDDFSKGMDGKPVLVEPSKDPDGLFYASNSEYNLFHTCNTWTVDALQAAELPVSGDNVILSGQAMGQIDDAAEHQCKLR